MILWLIFVGSVFAFGYLCGYTDKQAAPKQDGEQDAGVRA